MMAYQQPVSDAIWITLTCAAGAIGSLALYRNVGGVTSRLANNVAARNRRAPFRYLLLTRSAREFNTDPERLARTQRTIALVTFLLCVTLLIVEVVAVAVNGFR
jgi:hypothetical protein